MNIYLFYLATFDDFWNLTLDALKCSCKTKSFSQITLLVNFFLSKWHVEVTFQGDVWKWQICVKLTDLCGSDVSRWRVEVTDLCRTDGLVWKWRVEVTDLWKWRICMEVTDFEALKEWPLCGSDLLSWRWQSKNKI